MKQIKILGLLVVAAAAVMAFGGPASASISTSPAGTAYTSTVKASAGTVEFVGSFTTVKCSSSSFEGKVTTHGAGVTSEGPISNLAFSGCNFEITVTKSGTHITHATGGGNATWTSSATSWHLHTSVGSCEYTTNATVLGTLTGGSPAKLAVASAAIPRTGGNFLCGSSAKWSGTYTINTPSTLFVS